MSSIRQWGTRAGVFGAIAAMALAGTVTGVTSRAHASSGSGAPTLVFDGQTIGTAQYGTAGSANFSGSATTIPYWRSSFTVNGTTYPYTMVGADPSSNQSSTVGTWIIPLNFTFANGDALNGTSDVSSITTSPLYKNNYWNSFTSDTNVKTRNLSGSGVPQQYGDAVMRTEFNKVGTGYHVLLGTPSVLPAVSISVPQNQGYDYQFSNGTPAFGLMSSSWFAAQENTLINQLQVPSNVLPIFVTDSVFLYTGAAGNPSGCCILGWHGASSSAKGNGQQQVQTYIFASYSRNFFFCGDASCSTRLPIADVHALSHEVSEWLNDPFTNNVVPSWSVPFEPQYGCSNLLEAGDPLVGFSPNTQISFAAPFYHPQDIPLAPWFMRQTNNDGSINPGSLSNTYTYPDNSNTLAVEGAFGFNTYSPGC